MIRNKLHFAIGIIFSFFFIASIVNNREIFTIIISALAAISNIYIGFVGDE